MAELQLKAWHWQIRFLINYRLSLIFTAHHIFKKKFSHLYVECAKVVYLLYQLTTKQNTMVQNNETNYPKTIFYKGYEIVQLFKKMYITKLKNHSEFSTGEQRTFTLLHMKEMINKDIKKGF